MFKTLHLTNSWSETSGGIATFYRALMDAATRRQQPIRLVVPSDSYRVEEFSDWARIYHIKARRAPLNSSYRLIYPPSFLYPKSIIQEVINTERPQLVEVCDKYNLNYCAALLRIGLLGSVDYRPTVVGLTCERMDDNVATYLGSSAAGRALTRFYMRWIYFPFFDHHIVISQRTSEELRQASTGHPITRGVFLRPMGVDASTFSPGRRNAGYRRELLARHGKTEACKLLVYVGRLAPEKNLGLLIDTMRRLSRQPEETLLLLVGDGMERAALEHAAQGELSGKVAFMGFMKDREALADLLANCDLFLHSNPNEPFGIAPLEAMASGLPLVAPNSGGVTEYGDSTNSALVDPTAESFAYAAIRLLRDPHLYDCKSEGAVATAARFAWDNVANSYLDLYEKIHEATSGTISLAEAGPLYTSQPPSKVAGGLNRSIASFAQAVFRAYVRVRTTVGSQRA